MSKKIKFDVNDLSFKYDSKSTRITKIFLTQFVAIVFLSIAVYLGLSYFLDSDYEKSLKQQNEYYEQELDKIVALYEKNEVKLRLLEAQDKDFYQVMFGTTPPENYNKNIYENIQNKTPKELNNFNYDKLIILLEQINNKNAEIEEFISYLETNEIDLSTTPSIQPLYNHNLDLILYGFGRRLDPVYHVSKFHSGLDFNAPIGTPVIATADGVVEQTGEIKLAYGNTIIINHGDFKTVYRHLDRIDTRTGKSVKRGDVIGYVGTTGKSIIPHLHYEILYKDKPLNPIYFLFMELNPKQFITVYEKSIQTGISLD